MHATINTFPPVHELNSSRSWFMAGIVLLHVGFFWALNNGLSFKEIFIPNPPPQLIPLVQPKKPPPKPLVVDGPDILGPEILVPVPPNPPIAPDNENVIRGEAMPENLLPPQSINVEQDAGRGPVIAEPELDMLRFSEPLYPSSEIRLGHEGTVLLSVLVGPNGRVMEVKLDRSSGFTLLDQSAVREARRWRFIAGTENGSAVAMWTRVPVTFRLQ